MTGWASKDALGQRSLAAGAAVDFDQLKAVQVGIVAHSSPPIK